ncbi:ArnT family glycosyltransferase [Marinirhabdus gelatinilytica]|uniref:4-amino-4-deoxy-L-arabinose transferase-like glycosyltransferase n=1 Tax=Marinirhabdus gelatinilytica TaxID=1703343 RepID=A0A370Q8T4_9FLAO|nr:glycosyltransferase family 39 protein [Marinirhabdus gelatinilytica]RDK84776.1 4-amino-4-deoxy-L-arabinose transferase-like glycosyltransferase [Marinirhabdus gelatinilytica]
MKKLQNNHILLLCVACIAIFFVNLDALYVNIMEARNFTTAREMLHDGNWLLTTLNGEPRYQKPPLPTWLTAISGAIFGLKSLTAMRLPAALITLFLVVTTYKFAERFSNNRTIAFIGSLILATSFYIIFSGRNGQWDIFTHGFMMVCIYQLYLFFTSERMKYQRILIAALFFGASFMSKGPVSLYALLLPFLIAFGVVFKFQNLKNEILPLVVFVVVSLLLSGWWYWYTYTFDTEAVAEITRRETGNWTSYNVRPFYYYWSFFTQSGVWTIPAFIGLLYPYLKNRVSDKKGYRFTFLWTMASVILLSIIPEKKSRYLLPVLIPLALNTAYYIEYLFLKFAQLKDRRETIPVYFNFGLIATIGIVFPIGGYLFLKDALAGYWVWFILLSAALLSVGIYLLLNLLRKKIRAVFYGTIVFIAVIMCFGMPMAKALTINPEYNPLSELNDWQAQNNNIPVYEFTYFTPELIWDYGKPIPVIMNFGIENLPKEESFAVLVAQEDTEKFKKMFADRNFQKVERYDMNAKAPGESSHRTRLWRDLYVVTSVTSIQF